MQKHGALGVTSNFIIAYQTDFKISFEVLDTFRKFYFFHQNSERKKMNSMPYYCLFASMFFNFIVVAYQINKKHSAVVVSLSGTSIVLQGLAMRYFAFA
jgi:hypothetical protein